uniref:Mitochondrial cardiolipin hydrolase n=1 Tax=Strigamia maritima TaxID=126957 RepID=T1JLA2_STRMM
MMAYFQRIPLVAAVGISLVTCEVVYYAIRKWRNAQKAAPVAVDLNEVIFFPDSSVVSKTENFENDGANSLCRLVRHLSTAERTLDLCLYIFSCTYLCKAVEKVHNKGARVRVIIDESQRESSGSQISFLRAKGILVRTSKLSPYLMHHKFAVVDGKILINGSLNWTRQAVVGNRENVLVTNNANVVGQYLEEFEKLWRLYDPKTV